MHDVQLEDRLRRALHREADSLPFTITADQIEIRLAARRRAAFNQRLAIFAAAGLAVVAIGVGAFLLNRDSDEVVTPSPSSTVLPSASTPPSASVVPSQSPAPSEGPSSTPSAPPPARSTEPLGEPNDAVVVRVAGDPRRPDHFDVSLVRLDAGAFETNLEPRPLAGFDSRAIPDGFYVGSSAPKFSVDGWLAIGIVNSSTSTPSILVYDIRNPNADPWLILGGIDAASWRGSTLAVAFDEVFTLYNALDRTSASYEVPAGVTIVEPDTRWSSPTWLADGGGLLAHRSDPYAVGVVGFDGSFTATELHDEIVQSTGVERRWSADGADLSTGCPTEGGPPGCSLSSSIDGPATDWYVTDSGLGDIVDDAWDASGHGVWLVVNRTSVSPSTFALMHASQPNQFTDVAEFNVEVSVEGNFPYFIGIRDAGPTADDQLFLFGTPASFGAPAIAVSADGARATVDDLGLFAGWAGEQTPYPGVVGP
jgi:hypothetical protein